MNLLEILRHDALHNQEDVDLEEMVENYYSLLEEGFYKLSEDKTVFMAKPEDDVIFYHTANAAPRSEYVDNLHKFFTLLSLKGYKAAYTTLENPKLKSFVKRYLKDSTIILDGKAITFLK